MADGQVREAAGILSVHNRYLERLFTTRSGTSFAAPLVSYKAAQLRESLPEASANLTRALMALSAEHPQALLDAVDDMDADAAYRIAGYGLPDIDRAINSEDSRVILIRDDFLAPDTFAVYEVPIPDLFQSTRGTRHIRVALAYDPPVRHTRLDYAGLKMGFHLVRGATEEDVFDQFRRWERAVEGEPLRLPDRLKCKMVPGATMREKGTLQVGTYTAKRDITRYGDLYFLAVRCEGKWAGDLVDQQRFAVAVELRHEAGIQLYHRIQAQARI